MDTKTRNLFATGHRRPGSALQIDMVALTNTLLGSMHPEPPEDPIVVFECRCGCETRPGVFCSTCGEKPAEWK